MYAGRNIDAMGDAARANLAENTLHCFDVPLQPTYPLISVLQLDRCVRLVLRERYSYCTSRARNSCNQLLQTNAGVNVTGGCSVHNVLQLPGQALHVGAHLHRGKMGRQARTHAHARQGGGGSGRLAAYLAVTPDQHHIMVLLVDTAAPTHLLLNNLQHHLFHTHTPFQQSPCLAGRSSTAQSRSHVG